ncbi:MAG TPA: putative RiPP precursor [Rhizobiaceae bacterium]
MKKTYQKPMITRRENISKVTAGSGSGMITIE